jgi:hypothetical protein
MSVTVENGKFYLTRDGQVIGPMEFTEDPPGVDRWRATFDGDVSYWHDDGAHWKDGIPRASDLVAECAPPAADAEKVYALLKALDRISKEGRGPNQPPNATVRRIHRIADEALAICREPRP